jgi:hypothetical protein
MPTQAQLQNRESTVRAGAGRLEKRLEIGLAKPQGGIRIMRHVRAGRGQETQWEIPVCE